MRAWSALGALLALSCALTASASESVAVVAHVGGEPVTADELRGYIAEARPSGYRPVTAEETRRLLDGLVRLRILDREARTRGLEAGPKGRTALLVQLSAEHGRPVVREAEVDAFLARHAFVANEPGRDVAVLRREVRDQLLNSKRRRQTRAVVDALCADVPVSISPDAVAAFVAPAGDRANEIPPQPPGRES